MLIGIYFTVTCEEHQEEEQISTNLKIQNVI